MKNLKQLFFATALFVASFTQAQTADEVIEKYLTAIGGKEKLSKITSTEMNTSLSFSGMEVPIYIYADKEGRSFVKYNIGGSDVVAQSFDGKVGWGQNQMTMKAEEVTADQLDNMKQAKLEFPDPFYDYKSKGFTAEYLGKETKEGTECYKIKLTKLPMMVEGKKVPNVTFYYFDTENNVPIMTETEIPAGPSKGQMAGGKMGEYTEVEGVMFPFNMDSPQGPMKVKSIKLNTKIDEKLFVKK